MTHELSHWHCSKSPCYTATVIKKVNEKDMWANMWRSLMMRTILHIFIIYNDMFIYIQTEKITKSCVSLTVNLLGVLLCWDYTHVLVARK
jgi:hypothetical protein